MPKGVPVGTLAIGKAGAANAALLAAEILAATDAALYERLAAWRAARTQEVLDQTLGEERRVSDDSLQNLRLCGRAGCWPFLAAASWGA
jgi:hypothetical protein